MEKHALENLNIPDSYMPLEDYEANHQDITGRVLRHLIIESEDLVGSILEEFWQRLGSCRHRLEENGTLLLFSRAPTFDVVRSLKAVPYFVSESATTRLIFQAVFKTEVCCGPLFYMAGKYFAQLGIACMVVRSL
jgi:hypothetical protein